MDKALFKLNEHKKISGMSLSFNEIKAYRDVILRCS